MSETTKDVTINAYAKPEFVGDERRFFAELDPERDYYEMRSREKVDVEIAIVDDTGEKIYTADVFSSFTRETIIELLEDDELDLGENVQITHERTTNREHVNGGYDAGRAMRNTVVEALPDELAGGAVRDGYKYLVDGESAVIIRSGGVKERKVLVHQSERTSDERYELDENDGVPIERPALQLAVHIEGDEAEVDEWSSAIVPEIEKLLASHTAIGKVRVADCKTVKEGDCFSV